MKFSDLALWRFFTRNVTPLGQPKPPSPPMVIPEPFDNRLDLHGMTVQQAHASCTSYLRTAHALGAATVVVVTGRSGVIRSEFPHWASLSEHVARCQLLPSDGAFKVYLKRN